MFAELIENAAKYLIFDSIRDESLGDLWESDYELRRRGASKLVRLIKALLYFVSLVKASIILAFEELLAYLLKKTGSESDYPSEFDYDSRCSGTSLNSNDIREIRQYCSTRRLYNALLSKKLMGYSSPQTSYWIRQVDRIVEKCRARGDKIIDCEGIINNFMLSCLIRNVEAVHPQKVDINFLYSLVKDTELTQDFIRRYVEFDDNSYRRQLIFQTWSLTVYVISWKSGQEVWMHHHGHALDAIKIIEGEMTHWQVSPDKCED